MPGHRGTPEERFWRFVEKRPDGCWFWTGSRNAKGYGRINVDGQAVFAYRLAYELFVGPVPAGLTLDHLCQNEPCVNPAHLEAVTQQDNMLRLHGQRESCRRGHPLDGVARSGGRMKRYCRTCRNAAQRARARQRSVR